MAQFQYTAVNQKGKKLTGVISSTNEEEARLKLGQFGLSILEIQESEAPSAPEAPQNVSPSTPSELPIFEFEAYDKAARKVLGTIPASNRAKALKRLIDEYELNVSYIVPEGTSEAGKEEARKEDLSVLTASLAEEHKTVDKKDEIDPQFEEKRKILLVRVDHILEKIKELLQRFEQDIKPENKKLIQDYMNKLLRIKNSTNLEYIEHTCEELLKKVQDQELFLHKEQLTREKEAVRIQTQSLMAELHARPDQSKGLSEQLTTIQEKWNGSESRFLKGLSQAIEKWLPTDDERPILDKLKAVKKQIRDLNLLKLKSSSDGKKVVEESLNAAKAEKERLRAELKTLREEQEKNKAAEAQNKIKEEPLISEEIAQFLGWLLAFYLIAYFISYYNLSKELQSAWLPFGFNLLESSLLRQLLITLFLWYALFSMRVEYFKNKNWSLALLIPIGLLINAGLIFNL